MSTTNAAPTFCEWAGGPEVFGVLTRAFYAKAPGDPLLSPIFAGMDPRHAEHVAHFIVEMLGGSKLYSTDGGSHACRPPSH